MKLELGLYTKSELIGAFVINGSDAKIPTKKLDTIISNPVYMPSYIIRKTDAKNAEGKRLYSVEQIN